MKILVVEDHPQFRELISMYCRRLGDHEVKEAESLGKADEIRKDFVPDVVISDYRLPDGLGSNRFDQIREQNPRVQICLITGDQKEPEGHDADFFLHKPVPEPLLRAVFAVIEEKLRT